MKRSIPKDIDALMWSVAESNDSSAIEEFGNRYPDYRTDLVSRLQLVRGLKGAKPAVGQIATPPRFVPAQARGSFAIPRIAWVLAPAVLAGVAFASYTIAIQSMGPSAHSVRSEPNRQPIVERGLPEPLPDDQAPPDGLVDPRVERIAENNESTKPLPFEQPIGLRFEKISLHAAIDAIGKTSGLSIELAPGLEDMDITLKYSNMAPVEILRDMGANFGFTVFEQSRGSVLIVPEVDRGKTAGPDVDPVEPGAQSPESLPLKSGAAKSLDK